MKSYKCINSTGNEKRNFKFKQILNFEKINNLNKQNCKIKIFVCAMHIDVIKLCKNTILYHQVRANSPIAAFFLVFS